ncbi:MAG: BPL-N domain-containing protein [Candidatus Thorarchaeota archaeon]
MSNRLFKHKKLRSIEMIFFTLFSLFIAINVFNIRFGVSQTQTDLEGVNVKVYNGDGMLQSSYVALREMFEWMNATVSSINSDQILSGGLNDCDILAYPGGSTLSYRVSLGSEGIQIIRNFLSNGGSYFGICGGALFGTNGLNLIDGEFLPTTPEIPGGTYILEMNVNQESTGPDLSDEPASYQLLYWESQYYYSENISNINPIMTYSHNDQPGMITFVYGTGTVFLSFPHPEYEENSDRDGTSYFDSYDDPDSEWDLLFKISLWLYLNSPATPKDVWTPFIISISIIIPSVIAIGVAVFIIYRRRKS